MLRCDKRWDARSDHARIRAVKAELAGTPESVLQRRLVALDALTPALVDLQATGGDIFRLQDASEACVIREGTLRTSLSGKGEIMVTDRTFSG